MNIERTYCINLNHRTDRWENVQKEFKKMDLDSNDVIRFDGVKKEQGHVGCMFSHLAVLEECRRLYRFMILEDDVKFESNASTLTKLALYQLKRIEWDMLYIGCNPQAPIRRFTDNTFRLKKSLCAHAIIFNGNRVVNYILKNKELIYEKQKIDVFYADVIQEKFMCLGVYPIAAIQTDSYSDVKKAIGYGSEIKSNFNKMVR